MVARCSRRAARSALKAVGMLDGGSLDKLVAHEVQSVATLLEMTTSSEVPQSSQAIGRESAPVPNASRGAWNIAVLVGFIVDMWDHLVRTTRSRVGRVGSADLGELVGEVGGHAGVLPRAALEDPGEPHELGGLLDAGVGVREGDDASGQGVLVAGGALEVDDALAGAVGAGNAGRDGEACLRGSLLGIVSDRTVIKGGRVADFWTRPRWAVACGGGVVRGRRRVRSILLASSLVKR